MKKSRKADEKKKAVRLIVIGIVLVLLLVGFYFYVSHKMNISAQKKEEDKISKVQQILLYNLDTKYPPSPKEVVKHYSEITRCFYSETYTEEELEALAAQIQKLYDDELKANKTEQEYLRDLKSDIAAMKKNDYVISTYSTSASTDVEYFTKDGYDWATLYCSYGIRQGTAWINSEEKFLLRKDAEGHWKIYGWTLVEE